MPTEPTKPAKPIKPAEPAAPAHRAEQSAAPPGVADAAEVLRELSHIALGDAEYPVYDKTGAETFCKPGMPARLKALELLGKHHDLFAGGEQSEDGGAAVEVEIHVLED